KIIEVSTFRDNSQPVDLLDDDSTSMSENETDRIERDNVFGTPATDAFRRDLTINGLFYDLATFSIIDYLGGIEDLRSKVIRVIGDPKVRFQEDPVRMLRTIRHAARAGFSIEKKTRAAIEELHEKLTLDSQVRVYEEVKKDLTYGYGLPTLRLLGDTGLLSHILPELLLNDSVLLNTGSYFSQVFERIDTYRREQADEISITPVLAIIALFLTSYPDSFEALINHYGNDKSQNEAAAREELSDHLHSCFVRLAVPRKERERIEDLLALWVRVHRTTVDRLEKMNLERRKSIGDLYLVLEWLNDESYEGKLRDIVASAAKKRKEPYTSGGRGRQDRAPHTSHKRGNDRSNDHQQRSPQKDRRKRKR
ncbi:MAG: CCA tRNA nucleotidyltransferase, partial [Bdellovibrionales bacterium]|nr:CCA tRNA nucleotidyltransferase [Bdellovibrionales bacterium]